MLVLIIYTSPLSMLLPHYYSYPSIMLIEYTYIIHKLIKTQLYAFNAKKTEKIKVGKYLSPSL